NGDLDRLRATTTIAIGMLSSRLDELGVMIRTAPLLVPDAAAPEPVLSPPPGSSRAANNRAADAADGLSPDAPWWEQGLASARDWGSSAWHAVREDLGQFITVRRVDDPTALLMSPVPATRLRETLRLHVITYQLALIMYLPKYTSSDTVY